MHECHVSDLDVSGSILVCRVCGKKYDVTPHVCKHDVLLARHKSHGAYLFRCSGCGKHWFLQEWRDEYTGDPGGTWEELTPDEAQDMLKRFREKGGEVFDTTPRSKE